MASTSSPVEDMSSDVELQSCNVQDRQRMIYDPVTASENMASNQNLRLSEYIVKLLSLQRLSELYKHVFRSWFTLNSLASRRISAVLARCELLTATNISGSWHLVYTCFGSSLCARSNAELKDSRKEKSLGSSRHNCTAPTRHHPILYGVIFYHLLSSSKILCVASTSQYPKSSVRLYRGRQHKKENTS
ncbi:hypothetical protein SS1G_02718 [Sclerotinia sclerotiorum 1980 UF-70]|uniref:Uncharacterized protein n=2 Tax=Sclerotinia sclerotiorum (strain ATCC 18683 / 1980 / Ss-1) TaxID=665079 RepID=A7EBN2_SCLS1|nr:hypothetical protein SS1G_02718 [Sclerotinia sclerotiorum 1980 UF-70]APA08898.1 hypothetical protein sscle_04g036680 [Sclerotinia sclerotiorum 1980 UF-70]EDN99860.1 hypothetical protein SS1G_02718 [Sclerotinia sclerotiorum 1980 UF-70]